MAQPDKVPRRVHLDSAVLPARPVDHQDGKVPELSWGRKYLLSEPRRLALGLQSTHVEPTGTQTLQFRASDAPTSL